ncbi:MAG: hypothetical protein WCA38_10150 [Candidatus Acidiferrales bacterium]
MSNAPLYQRRHAFQKPPRISPDPSGLATQLQPGITNGNSRKQLSCQARAPCLRPLTLEQAPVIGGRRYDGIINERRRRITS